MKILLSGEKKLQSHNMPMVDFDFFEIRRNRCLNLLSRNSFGNICQGIDVPGQKVQHADVLHYFNTVPYTDKPWIGTFESFIPRTIGLTYKFRRNIVRRRLLLENCKKLITISHYGKSMALAWNNGWDGCQKLEDKICVVYPSIAIKTDKPKKRSTNKIVVTFCGNAFAQKGGIVSLRLAKLCHESGFPLELHLISSYSYGWTDVANKGHYANDLQHLNLPNVINHGSLKNAQVLELFSVSDFTILPTLHDTFGYSVIESLSVGTPAIATNTCAISETVIDGYNGYLLDTQTDKNNEIEWLSLANGVWDKIDSGWRNTDEYWELQNHEYDSLAEKAFEVLSLTYDDLNIYEMLSENSLKKIALDHCPHKNSKTLENIYINAVE